MSGTGLATGKSRGVDRHGLIENGLGLSVGGGYESGFVKCHTNARWYFYLCHLRLENAGREKACRRFGSLFSWGHLKRSGFTLLIAVDCFVQWRLPERCCISHQIFVPGAQVLLREQKESELLLPKVYPSGGVKRWREGSTLKFIVQIRIKIRPEKV